ncbi:hypothetical protein FB45DRAFT_926482, partial [Roridomyces roridus]
MFLFLTLAALPSRIDSLRTSILAEFTLNKESYRSLVSVKHPSFYFRELYRQTANLTSTNWGRSTECYFLASCMCYIHMSTPRLTSIL